MFQKVEIIAAGNVFVRSPWQRLPEPAGRNKPNNDLMGAVQRRIQHGQAPAALLRAEEAEPGAIAGSLVFRCDVVKRDVTKF